MKNNIEDEMRMQQNINAPSRLWVAYCEFMGIDTSTRLEEYSDYLAWAAKQARYYKARHPENVAGETIIDIEKYIEWVCCRQTKLFT